MILKYTIAWIPMVFIAIANGTIRQLGYGKFVSELTAHQISCFTGITLFFLYTFALSVRMPIESARKACIVGLIWMALTVAFEFIFGHYAAGHPWSTLLHDYNIFAGRLWSLVLAALALMPYLVYRIRYYNP
jgi:hypothetical protein